MFNDNKERLDKITSSYNVILNVVGKKCGIEISNYNDYKRLSKSDREKIDQSLKTELEYKNDHYIVDALKTINSNCASNYIIAQGEKVSSFDKFITLGNELVNHPKKVVKMNKKDKKDSDNKKGNKKKPRKGLFGFLSRLFTKAELPEVSLGNNTNNNSANSNNATNTNNNSNNNPVPEQSTPELENQEEIQEPVVQEELQEQTQNPVTEDSNNQNATQDTQEQVQEPVVENEPQVQPTPVVEKPEMKKIREMVSNVEIYKRKLEKDLERLEYGKNFGNRFATEEDENNLNKKISDVREEFKRCNQEIAAGNGVLANPDCEEFTINNVTLNLSRFLNRISFPSVEKINANLGELKKYVDTNKIGLESIEAMYGPINSYSEVPSSIKEDYMSKKNVINKITKCSDKIEKLLAKGEPVENIYDQLSNANQVVDALLNEIKKPVVSKTVEYPKFNEDDLVEENSKTR